MGLDITHADLEALATRIEGRICREVSLARAEFTSDLGDVKLQLQAMVAKQTEQNGRVNRQEARLAGVTVQLEESQRRLGDVEHQGRAHEKHLTQLDERIPTGSGLTRRQQVKQVSLASGLATLVLFLIELAGRALGTGQGGGTP